SAGLKFVALVSKETQRPSALIDGVSLALSGWTPAGLGLTRGVWPLPRSFMERLGARLLSPETRVVGADVDGVFRPSPVGCALAVAVGLGALVALAEQDRRAGLAVPQESVGVAVGVAGDQVVSAGPESDVPTIGRDRGALAAAGVGLVRPAASLGVGLRDVGP